uniref:Uncharacterized protein n=1 Tax=Tetraselmis sp. GSL018 TaxID=582737 RepID=A0A061SAJ1_9CHLO|mmetsp:Transcript_4921/g.11935  ORF Transcript_4921/g.11935 Transcript_4921/m.11935 type:complete len:289 (-) Transcript_4921:344-1210(-)
MHLRLGGSAAPALETRPLTPSEDPPEPRWGSSCGGSGATPSATPPAQGVGASPPALEEADAGARPVGAARAPPRLREALPGEAKGGAGGAAGALPACDVHRGGGAGGAPGAPPRVPAGLPGECEAREAPPAGAAPVDDVDGLRGPPRAPAAPPRARPALPREPEARLCPPALAGPPACCGARGVAAEAGRGAGGAGRAAANGWRTPHVKYAAPAVSHLLQRLHRLRHVPVLATGCPVAGKLLGKVPAGGSAATAQRVGVCYTVCESEERSVVAATVCRQCPVELIETK